MGSARIDPGRVGKMHLMLTRNPRLILVVNKHPKWSSCARAFTSECGGRRQS